jgi:hypothetical protein
MYHRVEELRQLPCKHHFYMHCIYEWLKRNAKYPLCVASILLRLLQTSRFFIYKMSLLLNEIVCFNYEQQAKFISTINF